VSTREDHDLEELLREAVQLFPRSGLRFYTFMSYTTREPESARVREVVGNIRKLLDGWGLPTSETPIFHDGIFDIGGPHLKDRVLSALTCSLQVSAYLSPKYFESKYCVLELDYGLSREIHWIEWKSCRVEIACSEIWRRKGESVTDVSIPSATKVALRATLQNGNAVLRR
jgi:hypothetical protein